MNPERGRASTSSHREYACPGMPKTPASRRSSAQRSRGTHPRLLMLLTGLRSGATSWIHKFDLQQLIFVGGVVRRQGPGLCPQTKLLRRNEWDVPSTQPTSGRLAPSRRPAPCPKERRNTGISRQGIDALNFCWPLVL